jgi:hypothetical protein
MAYRLLAEAVVLLHFAFVAFVVGGGLLVLRWRRIAWLHLPALAWGATVEFTGRICPLTPLENAWRRAGGAAGYTGGFVEHYLLPVLYPAALTREVQCVLGAGLLLLNVAVYFVAWRRRR